MQDVTAILKSLLSDPWKMGPELFGEFVSLILLLESLVEGLAF